MKQLTGADYIAIGLYGDLWKQREEKMMDTVTELIEARKRIAKLETAITDSLAGMPTVLPGHPQWDAARKRLSRALNDLTQERWGDNA